MPCGTFRLAQPDDHFGTPSDCQHLRVLTPPRSILFQLTEGGGFRDGSPYSWSGGDFNGAPGGTNLNPPPGDGLFNEDDIMASLIHGLFGTGFYLPSASRPSGVPADASLVGSGGQVTLVYDANTGQLSGRAGEGFSLSSLLIESSGPLFTLTRAPTKGAFDFVSDTQLFQSSYDLAFSTFNYGVALAPRISEAEIRANCKARGTLAAGGPGPITSFVIEYIPEELACANSPADFIFVLDSSGSLQQENWEKVLSLASSLLGPMSIGPGSQDSRVAVVRYSSGARVWFDFQSSFNKAEIQQAILDVPYVGKGTATGAALNKAREELLLPDPATTGRRPGYKAVVLVITDGATQESEEFLQLAATNLHAVPDTSVFALGITDFVEVEELGVIASRSENVKSVPDINAIGVEKFIDDLVLQIACDEEP